MSSLWLLSRAVTRRLPGLRRVAGYALGRRVDRRSRGLRRDRAAAVGRRRGVEAPAGRRAGGRSRAGPELPQPGVTGGEDAHPVGVLPLVLEDTGQLDGVERPQ